MRCVYYFKNLFPHVFWSSHWLHFGAYQYRMWFWRTFDSIHYVKLFFKCSKSTSKKYDFKKSNTHFSSPWVLDYACKKVEWSVEPDYQKYPSFKAMSECLNDWSILKKYRKTYYDLEKNYDFDRQIRIPIVSFS